MRDPQPFRALLRSGLGRFTLIEMLIVITIISILIATLLPALNSARDSGYQTMCLSNLRQIAQAHVMYADVYNSIIPYVVNHNASSSAGYFMTHTQSLIGGNTSLPPQPQVFVESKQIFLCPANERMSGYFGDNATYGMYNGRYDTDYSTKKSWTGDFRISYNSAYVMYNSNRVLAPTQVPLLADTVTTATSSYYSAVYGTRPWAGLQHWLWTSSDISVSTEYSGIHMLHAENANLTFFDGHAASYNPQKFATLRFGIRWAYNRDMEKVPVN